MAKVMVVDDEDELTDMIAAVIEEMGHEAICATNGRDALLFLSNTAELPALIISDVMMPQMNGLELARSIRNQANLQHVPIMLMSAAGPPHDYRIVNHFIHKPFDLDTLISLIDGYLSGRS